MADKTRSCPGCSRAISERQFPFGLAFCPYCGEKLPGSEQGDELRYCPYCGLEQACPVDFCPHCGKKMLVSTDIISRVKAPNLIPPPLVRPLTSPTDQPPVGEADEEEDMDISGHGMGYAPYYRPMPNIIGKFWAGIKSIGGKVTGFIREYVSGQYRVKRLYHYWTQNSALPEEAMPSGETLAKITRESGAENTRPLRISLVVLACAGIVTVFVGVGFIIKSC